MITGQFPYTGGLCDFLEDHAQPSQPVGSFSHRSLAFEIRQKSYGDLMTLPVVTIDYRLRAGNGTGVPKREHLPIASVILAGNRPWFNSRRSKVFASLAFAARISYHNFLVIEQTGQP